MSNVRNSAWGPPRSPPQKKKTGGGREGLSCSDHSLAVVHCALFLRKLKGALVLHFKLYSKRGKLLYCFIQYKCYL